MATASMDPGRRVRQGSRIGQPPSRDGLREKRGDVRIEYEGRKRSILVRFREPVLPGWEDFSADVIVAIDNPDDEGLFIPRFKKWDRSHPEKRTELVHSAIRDSDVMFTRVVRLLKHWNRTHSSPLFSWHIKAIALQFFDGPASHRRRRGMVPVRPRRDRSGPYAGPSWGRQADRGRGGNKK